MLARHLLLTVLATGLFSVACGQTRRNDAFSEACGIVAELPEGTDVHDLEARLGLAKPTETLVGTPQYLDRIFRYERDDGLEVEVGIRQTSPEADYDSGQFIYLGHYTIALGDQVWQRWQYADGSLNYRDPPSST